MSTLIISASPKKNGNSMHVARFLQESIAGSRIVSLADYTILPCIDCGFCKKNKNSCSLNTKNSLNDLETKDNCNALFSLCFEASQIVIISPIYFYHAPAQLKAFIDRSQVFWQEQEDSNKEKQKKSMHAIYIAARTKGEKLSQGLDLTLKYFAPSLSYTFTESICLYGLENPNDFISSSPFDSCAPYAIAAQEKVHNFANHIKNI